MIFYTEEQIRQAKSVDLLSYLQRASPHELVRISGSTYCLKDHDSLHISNGKWYWFSRGFGGVSAVDFLVKVRSFSFVEALSAVLKNGAYSVPKKKEPSERRLLLPEKDNNNDHVIRYLQGRGAALAVKNALEGYVICNEPPETGKDVNDWLTFNSHYRER